MPYSSFELNDIKLPQYNINNEEYNEFLYLNDMQRLNKSESRARINNK